MSTARYDRLDKIMILFVIISIFYIMLSTDYYSILIKVISWIIKYPYDVLSVSFLLTITYQLLSQTKRTGRVLSFIIFFIFALSIALPLLSAIYTSDLYSYSSLRFISLIVFNNTITPSIIAILSLSIREKGEKNPLKPALLFMLSYSSILVLDAAAKLQRNSIGSLNVQDLGIYELLIFLGIHQSLSSLIINQPVDEEAVKSIYQLSLGIAESVMPIVLFCSFIYALKAIRDNFLLIRSNFYYSTNEIKEEEKSFLIKKLAINSLASIAIAVATASIIFNVLTSYEIALTIPIIPFIILILIIVLMKK